jgi:dTDP-4-amino-4,6-dideoxygalactose transaminase
VSSPPPGSGTPLATVPFLDLAAGHQPLADEIVAAWRGVLESSSFIGGEHVTRFEQEWAQYCGVRHAVGVGNGTDALVLAMRAVGIRSGDEVLVPGNTFVATAEAVVLVGAVPRFVDVDPDTLLMTPAHVEAALSDKTAAVIAVHLYGQMCDMDAMSDVCRGAGVPLIEDAAQAQGASWRGRRAGSFGAVGCFSFYPGKNLGALGDAGAVVTDDEGLSERVRSLADHGRRSGSKYVHDLVGTNSRLDAVQAAALRIKLRHLDESNAARRRAVQWYAEELRDLDVALVSVADGAVSAHHLAVVLVEDRDAVRAGLEHHGVSTGIHYPQPCHQQRAYAHYCDRPLPVCEQTAGELLSLPLFPTLTRDQVAHVGAALRSVLAAEQRRAS